MTVISIRLIPVVAQVSGWRYALTALAIGPLLGTLSMLKLRRSPEALLLANGQR